MEAVGTNGLDLFQILVVILKVDERITRLHQTGGEWDLG